MSVTLPSVYSQFIHKSRYSRWLPEEKRREEWHETVKRYFDFFEEHLRENCKYALTKKEREELEIAVLNLDVMPSMRALMTAGEALKRDPMCAYNCSFQTVETPRAFDETMLLLMLGVGVGFSVEEKYTSKLPTIAEEFYETDTTIVVSDSRIGWAKAFKELLGLLYIGQIPRWDLSRLRPLGAPLKIFGGRSSGPEPLNDLFNFCVRIFKSAAGRKLNPLECHDIMCMIGNIVISGGSRRSALISLSDLSDERMRKAKTGNWWLTDQQRALANNSVCYSEKPDVGTFLKEWRSLYVSKAGERGIWNKQGAIKHIRKNNENREESKSRERDPELIAGTNPCITGDTLVYVADGRGYVPIKKLADENKDVPVFCLDEAQNMIVRTMRHPRITGYNVPILEIEIEGGHKLRCTKNHKLLMRDGTYREAKDISVGDSLFIAYKNVLQKKNTKCFYEGYEYIKTNGANVRGFSHRPIAEHYYDAKVPSGYHIHHKDYDGLNNHPNNLELMTISDHMKFHRKNMLGDMNPMRRAKSEWSNEKWNNYKQKLSMITSGLRNGNSILVSNDEIRNHALILTKKLGNKFFIGEWQRYAKENNLPTTFSGYRKSVLGSIETLANWAATELGFDTSISNPRTMKKYNALLKQGYDFSLVDGHFIFRKKCVRCGKNINTMHRELSYCSLNCKLKHDSKFRTEYSKNISDAVACAYEDKHKVVRKSQADIFCKLKLEFQRNPLKKEWIEECKKNNISFEISRTTSPFRDYKELESYSQTYNHRVVSVKEVGVEDVYNGTVDEYHNFFIGGFPEAAVKSLTKNLFWNQFASTEKYCMFNNLQCGEILLRNKEFCNLSEIVVRSTDTAEDLKRKARLAAILGTFQSTLTDFRYISKDWQKNTEDERLLGVSMTGIMDSDLTNGKNKEKLIALLSELKNVVVKTNKEWAKKLNIQESTATTAVKPSGTVSCLVDSASGIHTRYSEYYIRTVRVDNKDPICKFMKDMGIPCEPDVTKPDRTVVFSFPMKAPKSSKFRNDLSAIEQCEIWLLYRQHWTEHTVSCTIYVKEHEWLDVGAWVYNHFDEITGLSFLPHTDHVYKQAPFQEIDREQYEELVKKMPTYIDWTELSKYECEDNTVGQQTLACSGGACDIADLVKE